mgnify:CR=1 FL=1
MAVSEFARVAVYHRSGKQCEAMIWVDTVWTRCGISPVEVHHLLKRSQGGNALDEAGETYHLIALCNKHHKDAHTSGTGYESEMMIAGEAIWDSLLDRPVYRGPDEVLSKKYPLGGNDNAEI